jgi:hypothetical protein
MKLVKMSLAAAVLLGASAFAIDNVKVNGDAKLFYSTNDLGTGSDADLFQQSQSAADTALRLGVTGDLVKGVSFGATAYAVSTLGLENNLVGNTWTGAHGNDSGAPDADDTSDEAWMGELWLAGTFGKTTLKVGRMELDTPLAYSEKWSVAANTFDAAVVINQDLPDTTLVGAWVGKGNGVNALSPISGAHDNSSDVGLDGFMGTKAKFGTFVDDGAYAAAIVNNSFKPLTAQAWYYNVSNVADAYWLQADINCDLVKGLSVGAQYANIDPKDMASTYDDSKAYAFKLSYEGVENLKVSASYSDTDKDGTLKIANVATNNLYYGQSKLYTEAWWNYGYVGAPNAESINLTAEYDAGIAKIGVYYTDVNNADMTVASGNADADMTEVAITVSKSFGPLDAALAYISTDADDQNNAKRYDTVQAYLTLNF